MLKLLAFLFYPALELYLLIEVGAVIGAFNMVLWVFASALLGIWAVQTQGQGIMEKVQLEVSQGRVPQEAMLNGLLLFIAGVLLILPGLISDAVGILLIIPFTRKLFMAGLGRYLAGQAGRAGQGGGSSRIFFYNVSAGFGGPDPASSRNSNPREATIIDSAAVEIDSSSRDAAPDNRPGTDRSPKASPDGKTAGPGDSGTSATKG